MRFLQFLQFQNCIELLELQKMLELQVLAKTAGIRTAGNAKNAGTGTAGTVKTAGIGTVIEKSGIAHAYQYCRTYPEICRQYQIFPVICPK